MSYADRFTALIDASVLSGALRRNLILSLAEVGFFRPRWSAHILDETQKAICEMTKGATTGAKQIESIKAAFPESLVDGYEVFEDILDLPDPGDKHVLAAAISTSASVIVTDNLRDFPSTVLAPYSIEAISSDEFIADIVELDPPESLLAIRCMRHRLKNPVLDVPSLIRKSEAQGLFQVATLMEKYGDFL